MVRKIKEYVEPVLVDGWMWLWETAGVLCQFSE